MAFEELKENTENIQEQSVSRKHWLIINCGVLRSL
jgi:hypothetical protein